MTSDGEAVDLSSYTDTTGGKYRVKLPSDTEFTAFVFDMEYYYTDSSSFVSPGSNYTNYYFPYMFKANFSGSITFDQNSMISGLISSIIQWLKQILNAILSLPQKIADLVIEGLKSLFIPSSENIMSTFDGLKTMAESKLGFLYTIFQMVYDLFNSLVTGVVNPMQLLTIPRFAFPFPLAEGGEICLWNEMTFDILPAGMEVLHNLVKTVTSIIIVLATMSHCVEYFREFFRKE